jgi:hypothetical protein
MEWILAFVAGVIICAQAEWWLWHREVTAQMDDAVWRACVNPGQ